jgi:hypothetical protein
MERQLKLDDKFMKTGKLQRLVDRRKKSYEYSRSDVCSIGPTTPPNKANQANNGYIVKKGKSDFRGLSYVQTRTSAEVHRTVIMPPSSE